MKFKSFIYTAIAASFLWSCDNGSGNQNVDDFDVSTILQNVSDNIVEDRLNQFYLTCKDLDESCLAFSVAQDAINLTATQEKFEAAYMAWHNVSFANFGYAKNNGLKSFYNTFPTDTTEIRTIYGEAVPNFEAASKLDAVGFPGMDFVLFSANTTEVLERFSTASDAEGAKRYLTGLPTLMEEKALAAYNYWKNNTDNYVTDFKADKSKAAGSAFSNFVNEFVWDVEFMKNYQFALPVGHLTLGVPRPETTEALYSEKNIALLKAHLLSLKALYKGEDSFGGNGVGFDDYLLSLQTMKGDELLNTLILNQFDLLDSKIDEIVGTLPDAINNQSALMNEMFVEFKKLVAYFKVDMCAAFSVQITYTDNDGD